MEITKIISENTDEILAIVVVSATIISYFVGIDIPTEPMMLILGYYFGKKVVE